MDIEQQDSSISAVAAAIAAPARTRMLCSLMDGHARTSTELAAVAGVCASTASEHLAQLKGNGLVHLHAQGRHRYYSLADDDVACVLESLMVIGHNRPEIPTFVSTAPCRLHFARTCYDHMAGTLAVRLHDALLASGWLAPVMLGSRDYRITGEGRDGLLFWGIGIDQLEQASGRRRLAFGCMDWSMRRPHLAGALGALLLETALLREWVRQDLDSRALSLTSSGRRELSRRLAIDCSDVSAP